MIRFPSRAHPHVKVVVLVDDEGSVADAAAVAAVMLAEVANMACIVT